MQVFETGSVHLHWSEAGDAAGTPVVFINSLGTDLRLWDGVLPHLAPGLRVLRFDKRGHGLSSCPPAPYALADLVADTEALLEARGIRNCILVGCSIGGMMAQTLAARRPDLVSALVLTNTASKIGDAASWQARIAAIKADGLASIAEGVMARWFSAAFRATPELALWQTMLSRTPLEGYIGCCSAIAGADLTALSAQLDLPVLVIAGGQDAASPPETVRAMAEAIPGADFKLIEHVGHLPSVEAPEALAEILNTFIQEVS
ncbi:3-oxoadipate enol-lactonase [Cognatishimia sp. SS12]|uniref:3-oxoadipate enol-lactonase n=1 Tax=Cognatishimia sp. SS12 TaxID=2979465 RepID=UPI00233085BC|nr:3-oxoadipate enol-lactonase [Cognatishimia sp. SS12]MDC0739315.1 3-oxoadipate enol-lactonase [Cognatishimia sp. SS12]